MSQIKRGAAASIPTELHPEILYRLPSDDLLRFKLVSREWNGFISSSEFIQKHLETSISRCNGPRLLIPYTTYLEIIDVEKNVSKKIPLCNVKSFLGSCDGLALCRLHDGKIAAVNPSTGEYAARIPNRFVDNGITNVKSLGFLCSWFGHHPCSGEYVLVLAHVLGLPLSRIITFEVYTLSRKINNPLLSSSSHHLNGEDKQCGSFGRIGTFLRGRLHCLVVVISRVGGGSSEVVILVYSFQENGSIERKRCPGNCPLKSYPTLGAVDGCLSMLCNVGVEAYEVWVMKEYGVEESWTKLANVGGYTVSGYDRFSSLFVRMLSSQDGVVILNGDGSRIAEYSFRKNKTEILRARISYNNLGGVVCIGSLVSPHSLVLGEERRPIRSLMDWYLSS